MTRWCGGASSLGLIIVIASGHRRGWATLGLVVVVVAGGGGVVVVQVVACIVDVGRRWGGRAGVVESGGG